MQVHLVSHSTPDLSECVAACATDDIAQREVLKFIVGSPWSSEPWIQTGPATWELRARRERLSITQRPVID